MLSKEQTSAKAFCWLLQIILIPFVFRFKFRVKKYYCDHKRKKNIQISLGKSVRDKVQLGYIRGMYLGGI